MAKAVFLANDGNDRLVVSTICSHLVFFHEAGFQFRAERKQGFRWLPSDDAEQPRDLSCTFIDGVDPSVFGATPQTGVGFYKLSSEVLSLRRHCIHVVDGAGAPPGPQTDAGVEDARSVRNVVLQFTYAGQQRTLRHSR